MLKWIYRVLAISMALLVTNKIEAQINFNAQFMARGEYRRGYQSLPINDQHAAVFVSQRARLISTYNNSFFKINISVQDVRTWGSRSNVGIDTGGTLSLHEGYAELMLHKNWSLKAGRQEIAYDEDRIFGSVDWTMQARRHDAAILKFKDSLTQVDVGFAFNQDREKLASAIYLLPGNYKSFQYFYFKRTFEKTDFSFLVLNNGMQYAKPGTGGNLVYSNVFSQTFGPRVVYKNKKLTIAGNFYYQLGNDAANKTLRSYEGLIEVSYKANKRFLSSVGAELLSGTSQTDTINKKNRSFNPLYGTNHRFNGYMDYFFVGSHINSVGLADKYFRIMYQAKRQFVSLNTHLFHSAASVRDNLTVGAMQSMKSYLGTEVDLTFNYKVADGASIQAGYSQMFGSKTLEVLRGGNYRRTANWAYVMMIIRPNVMDWPRTGLKM